MSKTISKFLSRSFMFALLLAGLAMTPSSAKADDSYGCYEVVGASSINIRERAWSKSEVLTTAKRGMILNKWKRYCALRGFWCPVQLGNIKGHASKDFLEKVPCP